MIRRLQPSETLEEIRSEFAYSRQRLAADAKTSALALRLETFIQRMDEFAQSSQYELLIEEANRERCRLIGELAAIACASQFEPNWPIRFFRQAQNSPRDTPAPERTRSGPNLPEEWLAVASQRAMDATAILSSQPTSPVGAVYMAGYAIECSLKALLRANNQRFSTSGSAGHNLRELWEKSGFRLSDLNDPTGAKAFYIEQWATDLRYEAILSAQLPAEDLLKGARELTGWIQTRARRPRGRR